MGILHVSKKKWKRDTQFKRATLRQCWTQVELEARDRISRHREKPTLVLATAPTTARPAARPAPRAPVSGPVRMSWVCFKADCLANSLLPPSHALCHCLSLLQGSGPSPPRPCLPCLPPPTAVAHTVSGTGSRGERSVVWCISWKLNTLYVQQGLWSAFIL